MAILADLFVGLDRPDTCCYHGRRDVLWTSPKVYERVGFGFDQNASPKGFRPSSRTLGCTTAPRPQA